MWPDCSLSTLVLSEGSTVVADTGAIRGSHVNFVHLATDQVFQHAAGAGAVAGEDLSIAGGFQIIANCIGTGGPGHLSKASAAEQLAWNISGSTWLWRGNQTKRKSL